MNLNLSNLLHQRVSRRNVVKRCTSQMTQFKPLDRRWDRELAHSPWYRRPRFCPFSSLGCSNKRFPSYQGLSENFQRPRLQRSSFWHWVQLIRWFLRNLLKNFCRFYSGCSLPSSFWLGKLKPAVGLFESNVEQFLSFVIHWPRNESDVGEDRRGKRLIH